MIEPLHEVITEEYSEDYKEQLLDIIKRSMTSPNNLTNAEAVILFHWKRHENDPAYDFVPEESALDQTQELALRRGTFIHQLLQYLPTIPDDKRMEYAHKICPPDIDLPSNLMEIFKRPDLKELFGKNSLAEVPVVGTINLTVEEE